VNLNLPYDYDLLSKNQLNWSTQTILTHSSECWGLLFRYDWERNRSQNSQFGFQLLLNLMGTGFANFTPNQQSGPAGVFGGM
jgi:hypothetical protein